LRKISINQAVIFAGGKGTRLRPITANIPKPMVSINGIPFLDYLIKSIIDVGINNILILTGYQSNKIEDYYNNRKYDSLNIQFSRGEVSYKTGKRLISAFKMLDPFFLLVYGDNYWPIEFHKMINLYNSTDSLISTTVFSNKHGTGEYGLKNNTHVLDNRVLKYDKTMESKDLNCLDIGYFIVDKNAIDETEKNNISFEKEMLVSQIQHNKLSAHITHKQYYYITNNKSVNEFENFVIKNRIQHVI